MKEDIIKAAKLIQNYCKTNFDCEYCPFYDIMYEECGLQVHSPQWWILPNEERNDVNEN